MRAVLTGMLLSVVLAPASAGVISTSNYATEEELWANIVDGFFFVGRGDTEKVQIRGGSPPEYDETPFSLWNDGQPHAFEFTYNGNGLAAFAIDNVYRVMLEIDVDFFDGLVVTASSQDTAVSALVDDLVITDRDLNFHPVDATASAVGPTSMDYLLIRTDMNLADAFILSGTVTFDWLDELPEPDNLWFECAPVVLPEPGAGATLGLGFLIVGLVKPRR